ncbi:MAG TPA: lipid-A-disaccharide synthase [Leptolyngbyaceae cyanobacterium M65_K2018_010]|nr:lipid-A-disaccharide synthase [Leptolyngbyaceae cyanobacterium M65_K2018_010]
MGQSEGRSRRIFISTGEVSGDLQGSLLIEALYQVAAEEQLKLEIVALGGPRMAQAGATLLGDTSDIGSVGIFEALPYLWPSWQLQRQTQRVLQAQPPDLAILIDYMNPNLAMGRYLKTHFPQLPVVYYIAPQQWVWAFSTADTRRIVEYSDRMIAIFQAEADYFRRFGAAVSWVGHPLVDRYPTAPDREAARQRLGLPPDQTMITLLAASRQQEVKYLLPIFLQAAQLIQRQRPDVLFLLPVSAPALQASFEQGLAKYPVQGRIVRDHPTDAIAAADVALTKSGTANLEIALMNVPQVVAYRINPISARLARYVLKFKVPFVSPVNLAVNQPVVPEFLQWQATPIALAEATLNLLTHQPDRQAMLQGYAALRQALGEPGACRRAANLILKGESC